MADVRRTSPSGYYKPAKFIRDAVPDFLCKQQCKASAGQKTHGNCKFCRWCGCLPPKRTQERQAKALEAAQRLPNSTGGQGGGGGGGTNGGGGSGGGHGGSGSRDAAWQRDLAKAIADSVRAELRLAPNPDPQRRPTITYLEAARSRGTSNNSNSSSTPNNSNSSSGSNNNSTAQSDTASGRTTQSTVDLTSEDDGGDSDDAAKIEALKGQEADWLVAVKTATAAVQERDSYVVKKRLEEAKRMLEEVRGDLKAAQNAQRSTTDQLTWTWAKINRLEAAKTKAVDTCRNTYRELEELHARFELEQDKCRLPKADLVKFNADVAALAQAAAKTPVQEAQGTADVISS